MMSENNIFSCLVSSLEFSIFAKIWLPGYKNPESFFISFPVQFILIVDVFLAQIKLQVFCGFKILYCRVNFVLCQTLFVEALTSTLASIVLLQEGAVKCNKFQKK